MKWGMWFYEASISEAGEPQDIKPVSVPHPYDPPCPEWDQLVRGKLARLRYHPAMLDGKPVRVRLVISERIDFR
jgi:hypothetical protein